MKNCQAVTTPGHSMRGMNIAALLLLALIIASYTAFAQTPRESVKLEVEPRIAPVTGVLLVKLSAAPPEYSTIVVRLEGEGKSTGYMTLSVGSVVAINLHDYGLEPGLYYVTAYDTPGGRVLAKVPVLLVNVRIAFRPPKPTIHEPFTITVFIEPPGYDYIVTVHLDSEIIGRVKPGEPIRVSLETRGPHMVCVDLEARVENQLVAARNVTCQRFTLNLPPIVAADLQAEAGNIVLLIDARDPDGILISVEYGCKAGNLTWSGLVTEGLARITLMPVTDALSLVKQGTATIECNVTAVDDAGAKTVKLYTFNLTALVAATQATQASKKQKQSPAASNPPQPSPQATQPSQQAPLGLPVPYLVATLASIAGVVGLAALVMLRKRRGEAGREERARAEETMHTLSKEEVAEILVRLDKLENQLGEVLGRLGELQGEVDELRKKLRMLEQRVDELNIRVSRSTGTDKKG